MSALEDAGFELVLLWYWRPFRAEIGVSVIAYTSQRVCITRRSVPSRMASKDDGKSHARDGKD